MKIDKGLYLAVLGHDGFQYGATVQLLNVSGYTGETVENKLYDAIELYSYHSGAFVIQFNPYTSEIKLKNNYIKTFILYKLVSY